MLLFTIQNYVGSVNEFENSAATMFLLVLGIPSVVLIAVAAVLGYRQVGTAWDFKHSSREGEFLKRGSPSSILSSSVFNIN